MELQEESPKLMSASFYTTYLFEIKMFVSGLFRVIRICPPGKGPFCRRNALEDL